jgi:hypothetical protein
MPTITATAGHEFLPGDTLVLERVHYFVTDVPQSSFTIKRDTWWNRLVLAYAALKESVLRAIERAILSAKTTQSEGYLPTGEEA